MKRRKQISILFGISILLLILCIQTRLYAQDTLDTSTLLNSSLYDSWKETIFTERDFSNLVISIQAEEKDLYDGENGLLTSVSMPYGHEGERRIQLFVYDQDGKPLITQHAGIRISGASSRGAARKSFRVIARDDYDKNYPNFTYDLWGGRRTLDGTNQPIQEYRSFIIHSMRMAMDSTGIHNSVGYHLARKAGFIDAAPTTSAALYINGIYQGAYFLLPAKNDNAIAELYNISDPNDIELVTVFEEVKTGQQSHPEVLEKYLEFVYYVQTSDMTDPDVIASIEEQLDVRQCLQYYAVNLLLGNGDWMDNNLLVWRCKDNGLPYQDGKWRYFLFDLDWIGSFQELTAINFQKATMEEDHYNILPSLLRHPDYLQDFKDLISQMQLDAFNKETIEAVFAAEDKKMISEICYD